MWYEGMTDEEIAHAIHDGTAPGSREEGGVVEVPRNWIERTKGSKLVQPSGFTRAEFVEAEYERWRVNGIVPNRSLVIQRVEQYADAAERAGIVWRESGRVQATDQSAKDPESKPPMSSVVDSVRKDLQKFTELTLRDLDAIRGDLYGLRAGAGSDINLLKIVTSNLERRMDDLESRVKELYKQPTGPAQAFSDSLDALTVRVAELGWRIEKLEMAGS